MRLINRILLTLCHLAVIWFLIKGDYLRATFLEVMCLQCLLWSGYWKIQDAIVLLSESISNQIRLK